MRRKKAEFPRCETCSKRKDFVFCDLDDELAANISKQKGCNYYKRGQDLFHEGSRVIGIHCIFEGKIKLTKMGTDGREQIVRIASSGDILGYNAMLSNQQYNLSAQALDDATVCFLPQSVFSDLLNSNQQFPVRMMQLMAKDAHDMQERLTNWMQKSVRERLAEVLLLLHNKYNDPERPGFVDVRLSREEMANLVGTATESVIRYLSELKSEEVIELQGKTIIIINRQKLLKIAAIDVWA